jgi:polysaccharide deacetylase family sporulation protein PdaB
MFYAIEGTIFTVFIVPHAHLAGKNILLQRSFNIVFKTIYRRTYTGAAVHKVAKRTEAKTMRRWMRTLAPYATLLCAAAVIFAAVHVLFHGGALPASAGSQRQIPVYSVATDEKKIAISFDAAWGAEKTSEIMDILEQYDIKTTFFLVGFWVDAYPDKVAEIVQRGHEIGNHSTTHPKLSTLSAQQIRMEADTCADKIEQITGVRPTLFRPPYGDYNDTVVTTLRAMGYEVIQWSRDSLDWKSQGVDAMYRQVTEKIQNGDIVLFHNNSDDILQALPLIVQKLEKDGYEIVPVSQLLLQGQTYVDHAGVMRAKEENHAGN